MYIKYLYLLDIYISSRMVIKLNKEHNEPCMFSSSYSAKFDRAAEVYFYIMFKVRCHYFIQEINLLHKKAGLINMINPFRTVWYCAGISNFLWQKRQRCVHVGYSGHKTAETLLIFSIICNEVG